MLLVKVHEKKKKTLKQTKELETASFPEKYFRILRVKAKILKAKDLTVNTLEAKTEEK